MQPNPLPFLPNPNDILGFGPELVGAFCYAAAEVEMQHRVNLVPVPTRFEIGAVKKPLVAAEGLFQGVYDEAFSEPPRRLVIKKRPLNRA